MATKYRISFRYYSDGKFIEIDQSTLHSHKYCADWLRNNGYKLRGQGATSHWVGV